MALVLWTDGGEAAASNAILRGRWLDANGAPTGPVFVAAHGAMPASAKLSLSRLLDGSLVLQQDGNWTLRYEPGATVAGPAPDWLATRPNTRLSIIRQGTAYLLTFPSNCEPVHAALFSRSGTRCGGIDFPTRTCAVAADSGYDGTVMVSGYDDRADKCTRTFWPKFLN
jgi:hypothetical protein